MKYLPRGFLQSVQRWSDTENAVKIPKYSRMLYASTLLGDITKDYWTSKQGRMNSLVHHARHMFKASGVNQGFYILNSSGERRFDENRWPRINMHQQYHVSTIQP